MVNWCRISRPAACVAALGGGILLGSAQVFVSPGSIVTTEGGGYVSTAPFNNVARYQQIFDASQFLPLQVPRLITQIAFRPDAAQATAINHTITNIQINLSTTKTAVRGMNANFASNVGANDTIVFSGSLTFRSANLVVWGSSKQFDLVVTLTTPFLYDPSAGNLLLEIRNFSTGFTGYIDGASDSSVALNFLDNSATGASGTVQSFGLATQFTFQNGVPPAAPVVPELAVLDQTMTNYLAGHAFEAGTLALMKDDKLVLRQGYGWRDTNLLVAAHPDNLFRLASVCKPITGCAIQKLVTAGGISTSTPIYPYLGIQPWGGVLGDARIANITVQNLLDHAGGWNRDTSPVGDPPFDTIQISTQMGLNYPAAPTNVIAWMFSKPLDFAPGTSNVYSNFGYQVLGRVVEKASGKSYINYLQQNLLSPLGITNIIQSRSRPRDLAPMEIWYADAPYLYQSAVDYPTNLYVRWADGGGYYESFDAFGGLSASAPALCRFMLNYWLAGAQRIPGSYYGWNYIFYGSLPGTTTVIHQAITQNPSSTNGLEYAALFNQRTGGNDNAEADNALLNATASITSWPTNGGIFQWAVAATNINKNAGAVTVPLARLGSSAGVVKVSYTTYGITAGSSNFVSTSGVLALAAGQISTNITVPILNDGVIDPPRQFSLELISASGGAWLGNTLSCIVTIQDTNGPPRFVRQPMILPGGGLQAQVLSGTGLITTVQLSTNLVNWQALQTVTNFTGSFIFQDPNAPQRSKAFYRAVVP